MPLLSDAFVVSSTVDDFLSLFLFTRYGVLGSYLYDGLRNVRVQRNNAPLLYRTQKLCSQDASTAQPTKG